MNERQQYIAALETRITCLSFVPLDERGSGVLL